MLVDAADARRYSITTSGPPHDAVEAWTVSRLQYQKKDAWQVLFRKGLRVKLAETPYGPGKILCGIYEAEFETKGHRPDAENILFYNVSTSAFRHLAASGLRFERRFSKPADLIEDLDDRAQHHHLYRSASREDGYSAWKRTRQLATWDAIDCGGGEVSANTIWCAMKSAFRRIHGQTEGREV